MEKIGEYKVYYGKTSPVELKAGEGRPSYEFKNMFRCDNDDCKHKSEDGKNLFQPRKRLLGWGKNLYACKSSDKCILAVKQKWEAEKQEFDRNEYYDERVSYHVDMGNTEEASKLYAREDLRMKLKELGIKKKRALKPSVLKKLKAVGKQVRHYKKLGKDNKEALRLAWEDINQLEKDDPYYFKNEDSRNSA